MRGLSLSYKESIDQVWQAAAVSGFFVVMRLNLILEEMIMEWNFFILYEQCLTWSGTGNGCIFGLAGKWNE